MKIKLLIFTIFLSGLSYAQMDSLTNYQEAKTYQAELNHEYAHAETSPLDEADLANFDSLPFFPIDLDFVVEARFEKFKKKKVAIMESSTARMPAYIIYGKLYFTLQGKELELTLYQSPDLIKVPGLEDYLFLPFTDLSNGESTYGGGRYLDFTIPEQEMVVLNFNKAYNPYCAYSDNYSCPVPPKNNFLDVLIEAGVQYIAHD
ncbi:MAG: DUF1684 domain-containing protein [Chitinophagales bacterium]|nr:DUF1684 domain-containing protein [Chitinophagales bacterium]